MLAGRLQYTKINPNQRQYSLSYRLKAINQVAVASACSSSLLLPNFQSLHTLDDVSYYSIFYRLRRNVNVLETVGTKWVIHKASIR